MWSDSLRVVVLIELTCPAEEGMAAAAIRKKERYRPLKSRASQIPLESTRTHNRVRSSRFCGPQHEIVSLQSRFHTEPSEESLQRRVGGPARCSYGIWLMRKEKCWNSSRALVVPNDDIYTTSTPTIHTNLTYNHTTPSI